MTMIFLGTAIQQEHDFAKIIAQQAINGWEFDYQAALELYHELDNRMDEIYRTIRPYLHYELKRDRAPVPSPRVKDGSRYQSRVAEYWGECVECVLGPYSPVEFLEPDLGSRQKLMKQLENYGWKAINYTEKGNPQLDEESLQGLDLGEVGNLLIEYYKASQRRSILSGKGGSGWLHKAFEYEPGRYKINAEANPCGTNTHRCTHSIVVNVPKAKPQVYYGTRFRSLFIAPGGRVVGGGDAAQLEFRCALSYMNAKEMIELVDDPEKDVHGIMWEEMKPYLNSRDNTKNVVYGSIYGATDLKLGNMADYIPKGMTKTEVGARIKAVLLKYMPGLQGFNDAVRNRASRGYIIGIDGFPVYLRRKEGRLLLHTAVNTLLQHCGSMVVKRATVLFHREITKLGIELSQVGHFHDEIQTIHLPQDAEIIGETFVASLKKAGEDYGLACPMDGEWKIGNSWAETH